MKYAVQLFDKKTDKNGPYLKQSAGSRYYHWSGYRRSTDITKDPTKAGLWSTKEAALRALKTRPHDSDSTDYKFHRIIDERDLATDTHLAEIKKMEEELMATAHCLDYARWEVRTLPKKIKKLKAKIKKAKAA